MGAINVHEFITVDGVVETPSWTMEFGFDPRMGEAIAGIMGGSDAILLGRTTYEMFAPAWAPRTADEDPGAPFMNETKKYVVGSMPLVAEWADTTVLGAYDADAIRRLKSSVDGGIYVSGSVTLVRALLQDQLLDWLHLFIYPVVLGSGLRLFTDGMSKHSLTLTACDAYANGVVRLAYAPK